LNSLFNYYDRSGDGRIDYKEFTLIFLSDEEQDQQMSNSNKPVRK